MPSRITSLRRNWLAEKIIQPSPSLPAMSSAATTVEKAGGERDPQARGDGRQCGGQHDVSEDLAASGAKRGRRLDLLHRHAGDGGVAGAGDDREGGDGKEPDFRNIAGTEPQHEQHEEGQRRQRPEELYEPVGAGGGDAVHAHPEAERHADDGPHREAAERAEECRADILPETGATIAMAGDVDEGGDDLSRAGQQVGRHDME